MRLLLDACIPRQLAQTIEGHTVENAVSLGWGGLDDGPLLDAMEGHFDALVTVDRQLPVQQQIAGRSFAVVVLRARTNRLADLRALVPALLSALLALPPGESTEVSD